MDTGVFNILAVTNNAAVNSLCFLGGHTFHFSQMYTCESENAMATHSNTLAWTIPWAEEPGRLQCMGSLRVGYD